MELSEVPGVQNDFMDNPNALPIKPILALGQEDGWAGLQAFGRMMTVSQGRIALNINPALSEDIGTLLQRSDPDYAVAADAPLAADTSPGPELIPLPDGRRQTPDGHIRTKSCMMPWDFLNTLWNGDVLPCCMAPDDTVGNGEQTPLIDILNGDAIKAYRRGLLTGQLMPLCQDCTYTTETDTGSLRNRVREFLESQHQANQATVRATPV